MKEFYELHELKNFSEEQGGKKRERKVACIQINVFYCKFPNQHTKCNYFHNQK